MAALTAQSWLCLVVYGSVMGLVIRGVNIPLSAPVTRILKYVLVRMRLLESIASTDNWLFPLDLLTAPLLAVILLLVTHTIDVTTVREGIVGSEGGAIPYDVLVLFISLAYISTALDSTGALRSLASSVARRTTNGRSLFTTFYAFWFLVGSIVGNDPVVLSGTAFLAYFTRVCGIVDPTAWIFSQFHAANISSGILVPSNPTNVLIAGAFSLNYISGFTAYTALPSILASLVSFPFLYLGFTRFKPRRGESYIPLKLLPPDIEPSNLLLDRAGAVFHTTLLLSTLVLLVATSFIPGGVAVYQITVPAMLIAIFRDLMTDWWKTSTAKAELPTQLDPVNLAAPEESALEGRHSGPPSLTDGSTIRRLDSVNSTMSTFLARKPPVTFPQMFISVFPTTSSTLSRLPLSLLLFAGGIFVLSRALTSLGWTAIFAAWLAKLCINPAATIFSIGYLTAYIFCPLLGTNIGACIILVEVLQDPSFANQVDPVSFRGAIYSLAVASNLGAISFTFSSSLAGLLWNTILRSKGITVLKRDFAVINVLNLFILSTVASAVILLEVLFF